MSIGIPAFNAERYLGETIECFLAQTFTDIEVIVADNASTDGTEAIARSYALRDPRVHYVRRGTNVGAARNYSALVALARAPYFRWAAADDLSGPTSIERCLAVLEREPHVVLAYPKTALIDADGNWLSDYDDGLHIVHDHPSVRFEQLLHNVRLCNAPYGLMRTSVVRQTAMMGVFVGSDIAFLAEMALRGKLWEVPERLFMRRMHGRAYSAMTEDEQRRFYDPAGGERLRLVPGWRMLGAHVQSAFRTPLSLRERARVLKILARNAVWSRDTLGLELLGLARRSRRV